MIKTFFGSGTLDTPGALLAAFVIGLLFGIALERAGFGSSRRLAAVFYFEDMAVVKVMFTALVTAMLGLAYMFTFGWISPEEVYFMPTVYGAQLVGGLIFGVGFVMGGWCPGTSTVGIASGKLDALIFFGGVMLGSLFFNEVFSLIIPLYTWGEAGVVFIYQSLGMSLGAFALLFTVIAAACFWGAEFIEANRGKGGELFGSRFLKSFSLALIILGFGLFLAGGQPGQPVGAGEKPGEAELLKLIAAGRDHMEPEELADRLMQGEPGLLVVDIRPESEFHAFHIRGAVNVQLPSLADYLAPYKNQGIIVLYSNGMTHPAQARDSLFRQGFTNVYLLTDGLKGFMERCLKPVSLRSEPAAPQMAGRINAWRDYFLGAGIGVRPAQAQAPAKEKVKLPPGSLPGLVETDWLAQNLGKAGLVVIDLRSQPEYNTSHLPGSVYLSVESLRGVVQGVSSMLLPAPLLASHLSLMGIKPDDLVVLAAGQKFHDATLAGMAFERLGHQKYAVLQGGMGKWLAEKRPLETALPAIRPSQYPVQNADTFTVDHRRVLAAQKQGTALILDVRPTDYYLGQKSDEARAGHIPGAVNRPYSEDVIKTEQGVKFKPVNELAKAYANIIPSKETPVIVHCRTGHQASQTFFVLKRLLGYKKVYYYDAGWSEWAARPELPVKVGAPGK
jgi:thiosulfate/3-mercaptopyruvate sulfurtransferase